MGMYDGMGQRELQVLAGERGLSAGGSNAEIIARLEAADAQDLLGDGPEADGPEPSSDQTETVDDIDIAAPPPPPTVPEPETSDAGDGPKVYKVAFPCPGELSTGLHDEYRLRAYNAAVAKGLVPKGGLAGSYRSGWINHAGMRHAVYEVVLRKQR